jgi:hypothetical protein
MAGAIDLRLDSAGSERKVRTFAPECIAFPMSLTIVACPLYTEQAHGHEVARRSRTKENMYEKPVID